MNKNRPFSKPRFREISEKVYSFLNENQAKNDYPVESLLKENVITDEDY